MAIILNDSFDEDESKPATQQHSEPTENDRQEMDPADNDDDRDIYIRPSSKKKRGRAIAIAVMAAAALLAGIFVYNEFFKEIVQDGRVRGYVLKIEQTNNTFDSYEAVLVLDYPQEINDSTLLILNFSTRDYKTARKLYTSMNSDSLVVLSYKQYKNDVFWRGLTNVIAYKAECVKAKPNSRKKK